MQKKKKRNFFLMCFKFKIGYNFFRFEEKLLSLLYVFQCVNVIKMKLVGKQ